MVLVFAKFSYGSKLSLSIGGAYGSGRVSELVGKADLALYRAKRAKNCAVVYEE